MTPKTIYLIRHGQTDYNRRGIVQGSGVDSDLNALGRAQASAFHDAYGHVAFDHVYTSALRRTSQSVQPFLAAGLPTTALPTLNEISWGHREGQVITPEEDAYYFDTLRRWQNGEVTLRIEGGESPMDVRLRQHTAIDHLLARPDQRTVLVCMHGRAIRILLTTLLHYPLAAMDAFEHHNLCLYELHYTGRYFSVVRHDDTRHLASLDPRAFD